MKHWKYEAKNISGWLTIHPSTTRSHTLQFSFNFPPSHTPLQPLTILNSDGYPVTQWLIIFKLHNILTFFKFFSILLYWGTLWRSWLRHCATNRKVTGLIPDGVTGIIPRHNASGHIMALGLTQPLTEMNTRNISWGVKAASAYGWPYHLHVPTVLKSGSLNLLEPSGPVQVHNGNPLPILYCFPNASSAQFLRLYFDTYNKTGHVHVT